MLGPARDLGRDPDGVKLLRQVVAGALDVGLALVALLGHEQLDLAELAGMQGGEGEVLELPLDRVDAEPVRERREDLDRLLAFSCCFGFGIAPIVRMLWSRSASLMRMTRMSWAIATSILR